MYDAIIIGSGFAGATTAYHLSRYPQLKVLVLEQEDSYGMHASGKNAAMLRQGVADPQVADWIQVTRSFLEEAPHLFKDTGSVLLGKAAKLTPLLEQLQRVGAPAQLFKKGVFPPELSEDLISLLQGHPAEACLYTPGDGVVDIHGFLTHLIEVAKDRGVEFEFGREVSDLKFLHDRWELEDGIRRWQSRTVVNGAGAWVTEIGRLAQVKGPELIPHRRHLCFSKEEGILPQEGPLVWDLDHELYFRPEAGGLLLSPGDEDPHLPEEPMADPAKMELLAKKLNQFFPRLENISVARMWACLRTKAKDGKMYIEQDHEKPSFFWVGGLGGHGVSASMGLGKAVAEKIRIYLGI
ncbi:MAG: FAD-dependent oxidoreductase [bacterium]|nr:FAD-dependent oxidoreductase [bacterium]